jgi:type II secretory pathway component GspD/PulD (secretin)
MALLPAAAQGPATSATLAQPMPAPPTAATPKTPSTDVKLPPNRDRRRAAKTFLSAGKLFLAQRYETAMGLYQKAADLDPSMPDYKLAVEVARSHAVTALVQASARARLQGDASTARIALSRALALDPTNPQVAEHLGELGDNAASQLPQPLYAETGIQPTSAVAISPLHKTQSFHLNTDLRQIVQQLFRAYGIEATIDDSVRNERIRFDIDDVSFDQAVHAFQLVSHTFYVPLDTRRVLVARDSREIRQQYTRQEMETIYLNGLTAAEMTELTGIAKNVFGIQSTGVDASASAITLRAAPADLDSFNRTVAELLKGHSQVLLDVNVLQIAHTNQNTRGLALPQSMTSFNVYAEEQSLLTSNAALVQQIISSGLASASNPLAIIAVLIASGSVSSTLFSSGFALFGGGITESALSPGTTTLNLNLNSSDSRQIDRVQLRLGDNEASTFKLGTRYPIQTSSFSSLASSSAVAGLTTAGNSSALAALLASATSGASTVPMVEYQDLGLSLKTTANVMRNDRVALTIDMKIDALSGSTMNGNPVLNSRAYSGVVQLKTDSAVVIAGELDKSQSRAITGTPGLGDIPGLSQLDSKDTQKNYALMMIVITPHVVRGPELGGHTPMMRIERGSQPAN